MAQTPLATSVPPGHPWSSSPLAKSSSPVKRATRPLKRKASSRQDPPKNIACVPQIPQAPANILDPFLCGNKGQMMKKKKKGNRSKLDEQLKEIEREIQELLEYWEHCFEDGKEDTNPEIPWIKPHSDPVSQIAVGENRSELDEQLKETEREIEELLGFWEHCFEDSKEDTSPEIPWISKWHLGHPLDMKDEYLREDPSYNEEQVEQEALRDYLKELGEPRVQATFKAADSQKQGRPASSGTGEESPSSRGRPTTPAGALGGLSWGRWPALKKSPVITMEAAKVTGEEVAEESGTPSGSTEGEEDATLPKKNRCQAVGSREAAAQWKVCGQNRQDHQQPATAQACEKADTSSRPAKQYNLRRPSKAVRYVSQQEEGEERSLSEGSSGEDWSPEEAGSDADEDGEEEEEPEEDLEPESVEELEAEAGPARAELQRKSLQKPVRRYPCPKCGREFSNSSNLRKHLRIHEGTFPYGCHACGKHYSDPSNLAKHQQKHTGERRHQCPTCPEAFYEKAQLEVHIRRHQGIRPFACLECQSSFSSRVSLLDHIKVHVQAKGSRPPQTPVHCKQCNKTYASRRSFRSHRKRHRDLVCDDCGEVFDVKFKYRFHMKLHRYGVCPRCGSSSTGTHVCRGPAGEVGQPKRAALESSAAVPQGVVRDRPLETAASPRAPEQPLSSPQAVSSGAKRPSGLASSPFLCQAHPSDPAHMLQELSRLCQASVIPSQQNRPLAPVSLPVLDHRGPKPSSRARVPLQHKPTGFLLPIAPAAWPAEPSPAVAKPCAQTPSLPGAPGPVMLRPGSQASGPFRVPGAAPHPMVLLTDPQPKPPTVTIPPRLTQPAGSNPASGAASNGLFLLYLAPDTKVTFEIPIQNIKSSVPVQKCATCHANYVGQHTCRKFPQDPAERGEEELREDTRVRPWSSPIDSSGPQARAEREMLAESCSFHPSISQAPYAQSGGKEPESGMDRDCEEETSETEEVPSPEADEGPGVPLDNRQEPRQTMGHRGCYTCNICDKLFVHQRSFRTHMRLHQAFSCDLCDASFLRSEDLKWHKLRHVKKTTG